MKKIILLFLCCRLYDGFAQNLAIKSNVLYDMTTTVNLGAELGFSDRWSLDVSGNYNPWTFSDNKKLQHWMVQTEIRRWNCETFNRGFWGVHLLGGQYNIGGIKPPFVLRSSLKNMRRQGWLVGGGVSYGYDWYLSPHWNLEATIGVGYMYMRYDVFECPHCGRVTGRDVRHNYWGITRIGVSIVYLFNHK